MLESAPRAIGPLTSELSRSSNVAPTGTVGAGGAFRVTAGFFFGVLFFFFFFDCASAVGSMSAIRRIARSAAMRAVGREVIGSAIVQFWCEPIRAAETDVVTRAGSARESRTADGGAPYRESPRANSAARSA